MGIYKGQYVCEGVGHGWSETWYWQGTGDDLTSALAAFTATREKRRLLLGSQYVLKALRVSIETNDANQPVLGDGTINQDPMNGYSQETGWEPDLALLLVCQNATRTRRRNAYLRGAWDTLETNAGVYQRGVGTWGTKFNSWRDSMLQLGVGWLHSTRSAPATITNVVQTDDQHVTITLAAPGLFGAGPYPARTVIRVNTAREESRLSGQLVVSPTSAVSCTTVDRIAIFPYAGIGWTASSYTKAFQAITFIDDKNITRRAVGRPLLVSRGRAGAGALG